MFAGPDEIERQVRACLAAGVEMIAPGCATSPKCPNANLRAMVETVEKHRADRRS